MVNAALQLKESSISQMARRCKQQQRTRGDVMVKNVIPKHLKKRKKSLVEIGCEVEEFEDGGGGSIQTFK